MGLYFFLGLGVDLFRRRKHRDFGRIIIERGFNGATFAGSVALLLGIVFPDILRALGSLKPYLLFAGLTGLWYSSWALFKK